MQREDALHPHAGGDLADRERFVHAAATAGDAHAFERLEALLFPLPDADHHPDRVPRIEGGDVGLEPFPPDLPHALHTVSSMRLRDYASKCFAHKSGRRSRVSRSASACRHVAIRAWSPLNNTSGTLRPRYSGGRV